MELLRPSKEEYYLNIAETAAARSTCLRRKYGAVIVNRDSIVSTGYNGAPNKVINCSDIGFCLRESKKIPAGERYELCRSVHAEQNAIIEKSRESMIGGIMYLCGIDVQKNDYTEYIEPCKICKRMIIRAGLLFVISRVKKGEFIVRPVEDFIKEMDDEIMDIINKEKNKNF